MGRGRRYEPLRVYLNNRLVGLLFRNPGGDISFLYTEEWLNWEHAIPVSLSLPLREDPYRGEPVAAVLENLLPDTHLLRRRVADRVGARGTDPYNLLAAIGHDCVGALQFIPDDWEGKIESTRIEGDPIDDEAIEKLLSNLRQAPLGLNRDDEFRISVAGAQEKTALLRYRNRWLKPHGTTPTTHIFKTPIGQLPNGIDLSNSVENEYYCLRLLSSFGLPVTSAEIGQFGAMKALIIERFDRRWTKDGRLLRLPQEDCCQALSVPPTQKYESDGGPRLVDVLNLFRGSDTPGEDQTKVFKAQLLFWLIGATDGHAKNFSLFLGSGGRFSLTPLYDILTAQPSLDAREIERKQMKLAMSVGRNRHYRISEIYGRHFIQTGDEAGLPRSLVTDCMQEVLESAESALEQIESELPPDFPARIHDAVKAGVKKRLRRLSSEGRQ